MLLNFRQKLLGKVPRTREDFDPAQILSNLKSEDILVLDSSTDLPDDWREVDLNSFYEEEPAESEPDARRPSNPGPIFDTTMEEELERSRVDPLRVIVFTTIRLLGLLTMCTRGSVDGTFRCITKLWRQLFIVMVEYNGLHLPIAMAWLPDKTAVSYYVCLWLILQAFQAHSEEIKSLYGSSKLRLRKIKSDFEISIHLAFEMFHLSGCYFHYSQVKCVCL